MMVDTKILHISDLHFGLRFNADKWKLLKDLIIRERPDLLIITGDLVNTPWHWSISAAARRIEELREKMNEHPSPKASAAGIERVDERIVIVPGNHDTRISGLIDIKWLVWISLMMLMASILFFDNNIPIRNQNVVFFGCSFFAIISIFLRFATTKNLRSKFGNSMLEKKYFFPWLKVGIIPIDSASALTLGAHGRVPGNLKDYFAKELGVNGVTEGVWIAAVHHHPLPIPYDSNSESVMIMTNAGLLLKELANYNVHLVLHGHKHNQHLSKISLRDLHNDEKTIAVLGAGTPTEKDVPSPKPHSFNLLKICDRQSISVDVYSSANEENFVKLPQSLPIVTLDMLASRRLRSVSFSKQLCASRLVSLATIDEYGNCRMVREFTKLRNRTGKEIIVFPYSFGMNFEAGFVSDVFGGASDSRAHCEAVHEAGSAAACKITFDPPLRSGGDDSLNFHVGYYAVNFCALNSWQFSQMYQRSGALEEMTYHLPPNVGIEEFYMQLRFPPGHTIPAGLDLQIRNSDNTWSPMDSSIIVRVDTVPMVFARILAPIPGARFRFAWTVKKATIIASPEVEHIKRVLNNFKANNYSNAVKKVPDELFPDLAALVALLLVRKNGYAVEGAPSTQNIAISIYSYDDSQKSLQLVAAGGSPNREAMPKYRFGVGLPGMAFKTGKAVFYNKNVPHGAGLHSEGMAPVGDGTHMDELDRENAGEEVIAVPLYAPANMTESLDNRYEFHGIPYAVLRLSVDGVQTKFELNSSSGNGGHATFCSAASIMVWDFMNALY